MCKVPHEYSSCIRTLKSKPGNTIGHNIAEKAATKGIYCMPVPFRDL